MSFVSEFFIQLFIVLASIFIVSRANELLGLFGVWGKNPSWERLKEPSRKKQPTSKNSKKKK